MMAIFMVGGPVVQEQMAALLGSCRMISRGRKVEKVGIGMGARRPTPAMGEIHW